MYFVHGSTIFEVLAASRYSLGTGWRPLKAMLGTLEAVLGGVRSLLGPLEAVFRCCRSLLRPLEAVLARLGDRPGLKSGKVARSPQSAPELTAEYSIRKFYIDHVLVGFSDGVLGGQPCRFSGQLSMLNLATRKYLTAEYSIRM